MNKRLSTGGRELSLSKLYFNAGDVKKCQSVLEKVVSHIQQPVLTGSLALNCHLAIRNLLVEKTSFNDLDLVVLQEAELTSSITKDFWVAHYHPGQKRGRILLQLVEKSTLLRVDIFTTFSASFKNRLVNVTINNTACRLIATEDLVARLLSILGGVLQDEHIDPKYLQRFYALEPLVNEVIINDVWREYRKGYMPHDYFEASILIQKNLREHPERLKEPTYNQNIYELCTSCQVSEEFPLVPRDKLFEMLGYV